MSVPLHDRFWSKVDKSGDCWLWTAHVNNRGYGMFGMKVDTKPTMRTAHRVAYEMERGPIPSGLEIDHLCRVRICVNPAHLEAVTHHENLMRGTGFAATNAAKTHCVRGHEYTPDNTYDCPSVDGGRQCRACKRVNDARYKAKQRSTKPK